MFSAPKPNTLTNFQNVTRRSFMRTSLLATPTLLAGTRLLPREEKIKMGIVGVGWWGIDFLISFAMASGRYEIIGVCDVSSQALEAAKSKVVEFGGEPPQLFKDYRELYAMAGIEAVAIASPTHWHALQFIEACERGLDIWLEKPISYDIREGQAMKWAHEKAQNIVSVDFPRLYTSVNAEVKDFIQSGQAGDIYQIDFNIHNPSGYPAISSVPEYYDYDTFCGPAPKVPYRAWPDSPRPAWRAQKDFSRGLLADWGIHYLQNIRTVMDLELPDKISAMGGVFQSDGREHPDYLDVLFDFDQLPVKWNQKTWGYKSPLPHTNIGVFYHGSKATVFACDTGWEVYTEDGSVQTFGDPKAAYGQEKYMEMVQKVFVEQFNAFADAIKSRSDQSIKGKFMDGYFSTACITYADLAYRTERSVQINSESMDIIDNGAASQMLKREYREEYLHPYGA